MKPVILWLTDADGWAFSNRAERTGNLLPEYEHRVFSMRNNLSDSFEEISKADIIVCSQPQWLVNCPDLSKVLFVGVSNRCLWLKYPTVTFISDCKGWAYDVVFSQVISGLQEYRVIKIFTKTTPKSVFDEAIRQGDIVVASNAGAIAHLPDKKKGLVFMDSHRALGL